MAEYGRGFDWYISDDCVFRPSDREDMFVPSGCSYIEMWNYPDGGVSVLEGRLDHDEVSEWLVREPPLDDKMNTISGGTKLLISTIQYKRGWRDTFGFSKDTMRKIMSEFKLPVSFLQGYYSSRGCYSRHTLSELAGPLSDSHIGFIIDQGVSAPDDHNITFTWDARTRITRGFLRSTSKGDRADLLRGIRSFKTLASHPLPLCVLFIELNSIWAVSNIGDVIGRVFDIQKKTGHVGAMWAVDPDGKEKEHDWASMTLDLSFLGQSISLDRLRAQNAVRLFGFIEDSMGVLDVRKGGRVIRLLDKEEWEGFERDSEILLDISRAAHNKLSMHIDVFAHYKELATIQNQTVYNFIAQRDIQQNIEIAKDSKSIAVASKRDSSAMKSISLLTMVVLPGTFISTLFAVPLFDWDANSWSGVAKPRFWFYWAITVPLTLITLAIWMVWEKAFNRRSEELDRLARDEIGTEKEDKPPSRPASGSEIRESRRQGERGSVMSVSSGRGSVITRSSSERSRDRDGRPSYESADEAVYEYGRDPQRVSAEIDEKGAVESVSEQPDGSCHGPARRHTAPVWRGSRIGDGMVG
ncbi:hypothetical protein BKA61DRAFT_652037 [Leptodontidium sp. MPI-SDFR-AT-0119]|nr:hypothetical protein BKA61DRAFT_652037 [Leptodontidium sp. MPI-SDFR-AT-0119]